MDQTLPTPKERKKKKGKKPLQHFAFLQRFCVPIISTILAHFHPLTSSKKSLINICASSKAFGWSGKTDSESGEKVCGSGEAVGGSGEVVCGRGMLFTSRVRQFLDRARHF